jgi:hypothetical protein
MSESEWSVCSLCQSLWHTILVGATDTMTFPKLKSNAVAQYPFGRQQSYQNQTVAFVDGTDQRYRDSGGPQVKWSIQLDELDETELASLEEFFLANQGAFGVFSFVDPSDGQQYDNCSLSSDALALLSIAEMRGSTKLTVIRNQT